MLSLQQAGHSKACLPDTLLVPIIIPFILFLHADSDDIMIHVHLDIALAHAWQVCPYLKISLKLEGQQQTIGCRYHVRAWMKQDALYWHDFTSMTSRCISRPLRLEV